LKRRETLKRWTINDFLVLKGEKCKGVGPLTVNVCIHDFDDVKEESKKAASKDKHLLQE